METMERVGNGWGEVGKWEGNAKGTEGGKEGEKRELVREWFGKSGEIGGE